MQPLTAFIYTSIQDRGTRVEAVRAALESVVYAQPTQVHPTDRELFLEAIVSDLEDRADAPWTVWPEDLYLLALTAIKSLGRNPVGSELLLEPSKLSVIIYHSSLPFPPSSPPLHPPPPPSSQPALEALKILANLLVLHAAGRNRFANAGGAKAVARALADKDAQGRNVDSAAGESVERLFLLGRLGFLVTLDRTRAVEVMVDHEDVVTSLIYHLCTVPCVPANYGALSELLKLTNNILRFYPYAPSAGSSSGSSTSAGISANEEPWKEAFDQLLYPLITLFYSISFVDLAPPLSHTIHTLLSIPFLSRLIPTWHSVPEPTSPSSSTGGMKAFLNKLSNMSTSTSPRTSSEGYAPRAKSPSPTSLSPQTSSSTPRRPVILRHSVNDPTSLPNRLLKILNHFFESYLPYPTKPDDPLPPGLVLDEALPPLLLLLTRAVSGSEAIRKHVKDTLLPTILDRSAASGPLEARKGLLGDILRLVGGVGHTQTRDTARELMWAVCGEDPATLSEEIGYGNAAGILFQKGISGPPPAKIEEIADAPDTSSSGPRRSPAGHAYQSPADRNPITSLRDTEEEASTTNMTQEEKEREAERLFVLFNRMEKNPVISMKSGDEPEAKKVSMNDLMREKLEKGEMNEWERNDQEDERRRMEEEEEEDERHALREVEEYRKRMGRK